MDKSSTIRDAHRNVALCDLHDAGAHLLPCDADKAPRRDAAGICYSWKDRPAELDEIINAGLVGLVPSSIDSTVADVDDGSAAQLPLPFASYPTPRGGEHLYYGDTDARPNAKWQTPAAAGDIRSGGGYVILWGGGARRIRDGLGNRARFMFDPALFPRPVPAAARTIGGDQLPVEALALEIANASLPSDLAPADPLPAGVASLAAQTEPGSRQFVLFYLVRARAYEIKRARGYVRLHWLVDLARSLNRLMPKPLGTLPDDPPIDEPADIARKVHAWTRSKSWAREAQRARARLRRPGSRKLDEGQADDLLRDHDAGMSLRAIAGKYGVGLQAVRGALARAAAINAGPELF